MQKVCETGRSAGILRTLGRCAGNPRNRPPEGFTKSVPGNASYILPCSVPSVHGNSPKCSAEEEAGLLPGSSVCYLPGDSRDQSSV